MTHKLTKIVITGGPCAGKTTAIERVKLYYQNLGYCVLVVAETPTEIIKSGITLEEFGKIPFQKAIINLQIHIYQRYGGIILMNAAMFKGGM